MLSQATTIHKTQMIKKIKNVLLDLKYWFKLPAYRRLRHSLLFDQEFYLATNPDVAASGVLPLFHYLTIGHKEERDPCLLFRSRYYTNQLSPGEIQGQAPLFHYLTKGWKAELTPNRFFDHHFYTKQIQGVNFSKITPLGHFLQTKHSGKQVSPSPYFSPFFYSSRNPYDGGIRTNPDLVACYDHDVKTGVLLQKATSLYFDTDWYLDQTPFLRDVGFNPITHYIKYGLSEKRSPSPLFDPCFYSATYEVDATDLFMHYCSHGIDQDHRPCEWFDPVFYRQRYLKDNTQAPLHHFLQDGLKRRLYPNREVEQLITKPVISVLVPVYNADTTQLNNCIRSVLYQSYPHWELCLADDCSTRPEIRPLLEQWSEKDDRIRVIFLEQNSGIATATNSAASLATGDYIGLLDNDDELSLDALFYNVQAINDNGGDLLYSDEDLIGTDGRQYSIFRKPAFNDELLLCHNYVTHFVVTKRSLFLETGGCNSDHNGAQDLDLFLKLSEQAEKIVHIPRVLYHWRASESSTSINHEQKDYANEAGRKSVENALKRRGLNGEAQLTGLKYYYRAKRSVSEDLSVTVVVNWNRSDDDIGSWLSQLLTAAGHPVQHLVFVLADNRLDGTIQKSLAKTNISFYCLPLLKGEHFSHGCNSVLDSIESDFLALVSGDATFQKTNWLQTLLEYGQCDNTGMVGGRMHHSFSTIHEIKPIPDYAHSSVEYYADYLSSCSVLQNGLHCPQEVQSVDPRLCLMRTELMKTIGAFNTEQFPLLFSIHDLCYRLVEHGKKNIYTPYCQATLKVKPERLSTRGQEQAIADEKVNFQQNWHQFLAQGNPFFNTALLIDKGVSPDMHMNWLAGKSQ